MKPTLYQLTISAARVHPCDRGVVRGFWGSESINLKQPATRHIP